MNSKRLKKNIFIERGLAVSPDILRNRNSFSTNTQYDLNSMRDTTSHMLLSAATLAGIVLGFGGLIVCYFVQDLRFLAVPSSIALLSSLVYGLR